VPSIAINGLGRIGRAALKVIVDIDELDLVAVNDLIPPDNLAYLLKYDTVYGRYARDVVASDMGLVIDGHPIPVYGEPDPALLPWGELGVDLVLECTGQFRTEPELAEHIDANVGMTRVVDGTLAKVVSWYDNEWGFAHQMVREALSMLGVDREI
jgi:glyceraldehyde 3-phosphate dehydrogenase